MLCKDRSKSSDTDPTLPGTPPHSVLSEALSALRKPPREIDSEAVLKQFSLLLLPFFAPEDDYEARAALFLQALPLAISRLNDREDQVILTHMLLSEKHPRSVAQRQQDASSELSHLGAAAVRGREEAAIGRLVEILSSGDFTVEFSRARGIQLAPANVDDHGVGYIYRSKRLHLTITADDPQTQRYVDSFHLVVTRRGVRAIAHPWQWTGTDAKRPQDGDQDITVLSDGHSYLGTRLEHRVIGTARPIHYFAIGREVQPGYPIDLNFSWVLRDDGGTFQQYLTCVAPNAEMDMVEVAVKLPSDGFTVYGGEFRYVEFNLEPTGPVEEVQPDRGLYVYPRKKPKEGLHYGVYWVDRGS
jgi:hypothetical protein